MRPASPYAGEDQTTRVLASVRLISIVEVVQEGLLRSQRNRGAHGLPYSAVVFYEAARLGHPEAACRADSASAISASGRSRPSRAMVRSMAEA